MADDLKEWSDKVKALALAQMEESIAEASKHVHIPDVISYSMLKEIELGGRLIEAATQCTPEGVAKVRGILSREALADKRAMEREALKAIVQQALDEYDLEAAVSVECREKIKDFVDDAAAAHGIKAGRDKLIDVLRELAGNGRATV